MATFKVYSFDGTLQGTLAPSEANWQRRANEHGTGRVKVNGDVASAMLGPQTYVRVNDGTRDVFAWVPLRKPRLQSGRSSLIDLSGPGLRWLLTRCLVYPEESCRPVDVRWFGPMSTVFDDTAWSAPVSHGRHDAFVFGNDRGQGMADRSAQLVSYTTSQDLNATKFSHRVEFNLAEDTDVVIQAYADDYYRTWLDAAPLEELETAQQPYNWDRIQQWTGTLCAGTHTLYFEVGNLDANVAGANPTYICWSVMNVSGNGQPAASHHSVNVTHNHTSGQWIGIFDGQATAAIDWDATPSAVETAFNDVVGDGEVTVTGSAGAYVITADGPTTGYTPHFITAQENTLSGGSLSVTVASYGASGDYIVHSDTSTGKVYEGAPPGLTWHTILSTLLAEESARGDSPADHFTLSTTATDDTDGNTWGTLILEVPLDNATIDRVVEMAIEAGVKVDVRPDLTIDGWVTRGTDLSATVAYTTGDGSNVPEAAHDQTPLVNVLRSLSEDGWDEVTNASSITTYLRAGGTIRLDSYDEDGAGQFTPQLLADLKDPQEPVSIEVPSTHSLLPHDDYDIGDIISVPAWSTSGYAATDVRVLEITGRLAGRSIVWTIRGNT